MFSILPAVVVVDTLYMGTWTLSVGNQYPLLTKAGLAMDTMVSYVYIYIHPHIWLVVKSIVTFRSLV